MKIYDGIFESDESKIVFKHCKPTIYIYINIKIKMLGVLKKMKGYWENDQWFEGAYNPFG